MHYPARVAHAHGDIHNMFGALALQAPARTFRFLAAQTGHVSCAANHGQHSRGMQNLAPVPWPKNLRWICGGFAVDLRWICGGFALKLVKTQGFVTGGFAVDLRWICGGFA
eukprot:2390386-Pyramimonas_sp.AAC.1